MGSKRIVDRKARRRRKKMRIKVLFYTDFLIENAFLGARNPKIFQVGGPHQTPPPKYLFWSLDHLK